MAPSIVLLPGNAHVSFSRTTTTIIIIIIIINTICKTVEYNIDNGYVIVAIMIVGLLNITI